MQHCKIGAPSSVLALLVAAVCVLWCPAAFGEVDDKVPMPVTLCAWLLGEVVASVVILSWKRVGLVLALLFFAATTMFGVGAIRELACSDVAPAIRAEFGKWYIWLLWTSVIPGPVSGLVKTAIVGYGFARRLPPHDLRPR
jgi:hypothetical protein